MADAFQLAIILPDALRQRDDLCSRMGPRAGRSASGMCATALLWKLRAGHLGKRAPKDLTAPLPWVDQLRAATDQCLTRADDGQVSLALYAPVLERIEQLRIEACQAS